MRLQPARAQRRDHLPELPGTVRGQRALRVGHHGRRSRQGKGAGVAVSAAQRVNEVVGAAWVAPARPEGCPAPLEFGLREHSRGAASFRVRLRLSFPCGLTAMSWTCRTVLFQGVQRSNSITRLSVLWNGHRNEFP